MAKQNIFLNKAKDIFIAATPVVIATSIGTLVVSPSLAVVPGVLLLGEAGIALHDGDQQAR